MKKDHTFFSEKVNFPNSAGGRRISTSVGYSLLGDIQRPKRATIRPDNLSKFLFLKYNFE